MRYARVAGRCPCGCGETLFVAEGGHITCSWLDCPNPSAAEEAIAKAGSDDVREWVALVPGRGWDSLIGAFENEEEWTAKVDAYYAVHPPKPRVTLRKVFLHMTETDPKVFS